MGLVYGRMNFTSAARPVSCDHKKCSPTKARPECRSKLINSRSGEPMELGDDEDGAHGNDSSPSVRITRQASRSMAQAAVQQRLIRRSARLMGSGGGRANGGGGQASFGGVRLMSGSSNSVASTLRRSARIARVGTGSASTAGRSSRTNVGAISRVSSRLAGATSAQVQGRRCRQASVGCDIRRSERLMTQRRSH